MHDPGGSRLFPLQPGVHGTAYLTPDERHRLWLARVWGPNARYVAIVGLNPSTARPDMDDPTIRRDIGFAQRLGFDGVFKLNAATYRVTDPKELLTCSDIVHPENEHILRRVAARCSQVIVAWGAYNPKLMLEVVRALAVLREAKSDIWCFGTTKHGHPRHTLYLRADTELVRFLGATNALLPPSSP